MNGAVPPRTFEIVIEPKLEPPGLLQVILTFVKSKVIASG